jgi:hypothetical protein
MVVSAGWMVKRRECCDAVSTRWTGIEGAAEPAHGRTDTGMGGDTLSGGAAAQHHQLVCGVTIPIQNIVLSPTSTS